MLGRRLTISDCDDGPGEVSRAKACLKKLAGQDKVFADIDDCSDARTPFDQCDGKPSPNQGLPPPRAYPECAGISWELSAAIVVGQHKV